MTASDVRTRSRSSDEPDGVGSVGVRKWVLRDLITHARQEAPNECCGLLLGERQVVERSVRARNVRASPSQYLIDPRDHFAALRLARATGLCVLGAYHSHPAGGAEPSARDLAEANYPEYVYVIVALAGGFAPEVRGYRLTPLNFREVHLVRLP